MDTLRLSAPKPRMIAHRGLSGIEMENTCSAFVAAGNRSYFGIETDVHVTAPAPAGQGRSAGPEGFRASFPAGIRANLQKVRKDKRAGAEKPHGACAH